MSLTRDVMPSASQLKKRTVTGNILDINRAISVLSYKVPGIVKEYFNTMSFVSNIYGSVSESLTITIDDKVVPPLSSTSVLRRFCDAC